MSIPPPPPTRPAQRRSVATTVGTVDIEAFRGVVGLVPCAGRDTWSAIEPVATRDGVLVVDAREDGVLPLLESLGTDGPLFAVLSPQDLAAFGVAVA